MLHSSLLSLFPPSLSSFLSSFFPSILAGLIFHFFLSFLPPSLSSFLSLLFPSFLTCYILHFFLSFLPPSLCSFLSSFFPSFLACFILLFFSSFLHSLRPSLSALHLPFLPTYSLLPIAAVKLCFLQLLDSSNEPKTGYAGNSVRSTGAHPTECQCDILLSVFKKMTHVYNFLYYVHLMTQ
jgi:hypothetical protein